MFFIYATKTLTPAVNQQVEKRRPALNQWTHPLYSKELSGKISPILRLQKICFSVRGLGNRMYVRSIYRKSSDIYAYE